MKTTGWVVFAENPTRVFGVRDQHQAAYALRDASAVDGLTFKDVIVRWAEYDDEAGTVTTREPPPAAHM